MLVFDIETGSLPEDQLKAMCPPFDEADVKCGNLKDPEKIAAKIAEALVNHLKDFIDRAALSAATGQVLAIGCYSPDSKTMRIIEGDEPDILSAWWSVASKMIKSDREMVGHNIFNFDLPFLVRRSRILKVDVPKAIYTISGRWVNWHKLFIDTRMLWQMGDAQCESSLDHVSRAFGCGGKPDDVTGADFARLYRGTVKERAKAIEYLENDLKMTAGVVDRLFVGA